MYAFIFIPGKVTKLSGEFIPNGDFKSTKKLTWLAKVTHSHAHHPLADLLAGFSVALGLAAAVNFSQT